MLLRLYVLTPVRSGPTLIPMLALTFSALGRAILA
jgi:hypothetical protein